jgi:hypothetical protein
VANMRLLTMFGIGDPYTITVEAFADTEFTDPTPTLLLCLAFDACAARQRVSGSGGGRAAEVDRCLAPTGLSVRMPGSADRCSAGRGGSGCPADAKAWRRGLSLRGGRRQVRRLSRLRDLRLLPPGNVVGVPKAAAAGDGLGRRGGAGGAGGPRARLRQQAAMVIDVATARRRRRRRSLIAVAGSF